MKGIRERKDCKIDGKTIKSVSDHIYTYSTAVKVETRPAPIQSDKNDESLTFSDQIKKHYNFNLDAEVKQAKLKGSKVIADKYDKCIVIDENFSIENDMPDFIVQYFDLTRAGNIIKKI
jgi:hypothetical protein